MSHRISLIKPNKSSHNLPQVTTSDSRSHHTLYNTPTRTLSGIVILKLDRVGHREKFVSNKPPLEQGSLKSIHAQEHPSH